MYNVTWSLMTEFTFQNVSLLEPRFGAWGILVARAFLLLIGRAPWKRGRLRPGTGNLVFRASP